MLTHQQRKVMLFIEAEVDRTGGVPPTVADIAAHLKLRNRSGAQRLVSGLVERGFIRRLDGAERGIEVIKRVSRFAYMRFDDQSKTLVSAQPP